MQISKFPDIQVIQILFSGKGLEIEMKMLAISHANQPKNFHKSLFIVVTLVHLESKSKFSTGSVVALGKQETPLASANSTPGGGKREQRSCSLHILLEGSGNDVRCAPACSYQQWWR